MEMEMNVNNLKNVKHLFAMKIDRRCAKAVCLKGDVYVFGGSDDKNCKIMTIEKYATLDDCRSTVTRMYDDRFIFIFVRLLIRYTCLEVLMKV